MVARPDPGFIEFERSSRMPGHYERLRRPDERSRDDNQRANCNRPWKRAGSITSALRKSADTAENPPDGTHRDRDPDGLRIQQHVKHLPRHVGIVAPRMCEQVEPAG